MEQEDKTDAATVHELKDELKTILQDSNFKNSSQSVQDMIRIQNTDVGTSKTWEAGAKV
jgi:hypothetical protein